MIVAILATQIFIQLIVQEGHSTLTYIGLYAAYTLAVVIMQSRWSAVWARYDELDLRLNKMKSTKDKK